MWSWSLACSAPVTAPLDTGTAPPEPDEVRLVAFNVESGDADPVVVAAEGVATQAGEALWALSEVDGEAAAEVLVAAAADAGTDQDFRYVLGTTGWDDRLALAWDDARFSLEDWEELDEINVGGTVRAPLVGRLRERATGVEVTLVVNHLWRTDEAGRHAQAALLHDWGLEQEGPVVLAGDFNFDWDVTSGRHDRGYDLLTADGAFTWLRPATLVASQCSSFYDSVLDFVFVNPAAEAWAGESEILFPEREWCLLPGGSDHRPVEAHLSLPGG